MTPPLPAPAADEYPRRLALHALGVTVLVGIGAAWPTALFITPLLINRGNAAGVKQ